MNEFSAFRSNDEPADDEPEAADGLPDRPRFAFLVRLAQLLHGYGTPAHRLDDTVIRCADSLGVTAEVFSTPTLLMAAFGRGVAQRTHLLSTRARDIDLGALMELDAVRDDVEAGRCTPREGTHRLDGIAKAPPRYSGLATAVSYGVASAGAAVLFGGNGVELSLALTLGVLTGVLARVLGRRSTATRIFEPTAAFLAAFLTGLAAALLPGLQTQVVILSALIAIVPGLSLTLGLTEMATRHLMSGTTRLAGVLVVFLTIGLGVALGRELAALIVEAPPTPPLTPLPVWTSWIAVALSSGAFLVLFQARLSELGWILAAGMLAFGGARTGALVLGPELGGFVGALAIGLGSNVYAHRLDRPASVPLLPGILMLVPGSIGYRSLASFLANDVVSGVETAFRMALVAVALVGGLLVANVVFTPRRSL